jgi:hypothetical protein
MSGLDLKRYLDPRTRQRAVASYSWLAGLEPAARLPRLRPAPDGEHLMFEHVNGRHARPEDLPLLAACLGGMHGAAHARELHQARLPQRYRTRAGHTLPAFPDGRVDAVARELRSGRVPDARLTVHQAQELIMDVDGPAAFYKDANQRNFLITPGSTRDDAPRPQVSGHLSARPRVSGPHRQQNRLLRPANLAGHRGQGKASRCHECPS